MPRMRSVRWIILPTIVLAAVLLTVFAPRAWFLLLTDGLLAAAVIVGAAGLGAWPVVWLGLGGRALGQQVCIAAALGTGIVSLVTLGLGLAGWLSGAAGWVLLGVGGAAGLGRVYLAQKDRGGDAGPSRNAASILQSAVLLPLAIPLAIAFFGATLPPGLLWADEARGYDVLEYHLQGPKEYFNDGRISFLGHNVYTSFPQQMEMQYLLLMHLGDGPYAAAIPAQLLHALYGVLAAAALASWARGRWGAVVAALAGGSVPWLAYLGCLAYVELGMLFYAAVAAGLVVDHFHESTSCDWRTALGAGICAGLAGGCKYTALAFVGVGLAVAWLCVVNGPLVPRLRRIAWFGAGALLAFGPWLARNAALAGNPVYPFAYSVFGGRDWSPEQDEQWKRGHRLKPVDDSPAGRARIAVREIFGERVARPAAAGGGHEFNASLFGPVLLILAAVGMTARSRRTWLLSLWAGLIVIGWSTLTHMPGRFVVPMIVPLALLAGSGAELRGLRRGVAVILAVCGSGLNAWSLAARLQAENAWYARNALLEADDFVQANAINSHTPPGADVWMVGEARAFYAARRIHYTVAFNRDPWLTFADGRADAVACVDWLRSRNVTHVVFFWTEIDRLRQTYGFSERVTPGWVADLAANGLQRVYVRRMDSGKIAIEIFQVTSE